MQWVTDVLACKNPRLDNMTWDRSTCITHSHAFLTKLDDYAIDAKAYHDTMVCLVAEADIVRTIIVCHRWRNKAVFHFLKKHSLLLTTWTQLAEFGEQWETEHSGTAAALFPGRRLWEDGSLSTGSTGETKRTNTGEVITTLRSVASMDVAAYKNSSPADKQTVLKGITGIGELNYSHLSRVLDHVLGCGLAHVRDTGSNTKAVLDLIAVPSVAVAARRLTPHFRDCGLLQDNESLSNEEAQMDLCVTVYSIQTFLSGTNSHHPRLSLKNIVSVKSIIPASKLRAWRSMAHAKPGRKKRKNVEVLAINSMADPTLTNSRAFHVGLCRRPLAHGRRQTVWHKQQ